MLDLKLMNSVPPETMWDDELGKDVVGGEVLRRDFKKVP